MLRPILWVWKHKIKMRPDARFKGQKWTIYNYNQWMYYLQCPKLNFRVNQTQTPQNSTSKTNSILNGKERKPKYNHSTLLTPWIKQKVYTVIYNYRYLHIYWNTVDSKGSKTQTNTVTLEHTTLTTQFVKQSLEDEVKEKCAPSWKTGAVTPNQQHKP